MLPPSYLMTIQTFSTDPVAPRVVRTIAVIALAAGLGIWAALLLAPTPQKLAPVLSTYSANPGIQPMAQWFGGRTLGIKIDLAGVIANTGGQGAALLSINNQPARTYRNGHLSRLAFFLKRCHTTVSPSARMAWLKIFPLPANKPTIPMASSPRTQTDIYVGTLGS